MITIHCFFYNYFELGRTHVLNVELAVGKDHQRRRGKLRCRDGLDAPVRSWSLIPLNRYEREKRNG